MDTDVPQKRPQPTEIEMPMISVNGVFIDETVLANELQYHPHDDFERVIQQAGQSLVIKMLLQQKAEACGCDMSAGEESAISLLLQQQVTYQVPTEEDCLRYYENNRATFTTEPLLALDHILLPAAIDEPIEREQARQTAVRLIEMLLDDITLFATLAQQHSACPSKQVGGALGQISRNQTVPEFERQVLQYEQGLIAEPITSRYGIHVVNIVNKITGEQLDYPHVEDKIRGYLVDRASRLAIQSYIYNLIEVADIQGIEVGFEPSANIAV